MLEDERSFTEIFAGFKRPLGQELAHALVMALVVRSHFLDHLGRPASMPGRLPVILVFVKNMPHFLIVGPGLLAAYCLGGIRRHNQKKH